MAQLTLTQDPAKGLPGMQADSGVKDDVSRLAEVADIKPGLFTVRGTADNQVLLPTATFTEDEVAGISVRTHRTRDDGAVSDNENYELNSRIPIRRKGRIWVTVEDGFTAGAPVFARFAVGGGGTELGATRTDADTASAVAVAGARLVTSGLAGELGIVELNL